MKQFFLVCLCFLSFQNLQAADWQQLWVQAVKKCRDKNYSQAEALFNKAIEATDVDTHPHLLVDRARLNMAQHRYKQALPDLDRALQSNQLEGKDRIRALVSRVIVRSQAGMAEGVAEDMETFRQLNTNGPKIEISHDRIIIRNVPDCKCYINLVKSLCLDAGICKKESDIQFLPAGIFLIERTIDTCFVPYQEADCLAAAVWSSQTFTRLNCQIGSLLAIDFLKQLCQWSSLNDAASKMRTNPFEKLAAYIGTPCEPFWD
jgi:tetratricopeptide (TPR) repeat protein